MRRYKNVSIREFCAAAIVCVALVGCGTVPTSVRRALARPYKPTNVFLRQATLPPELRRVAVLPIEQEGTDPGASTPSEWFQPLLTTEFGKRNLFELVPVARDDLRSLTGGSARGANEKLPADFFERLHEATGCDLVLFAEVTTFHAYPPLRIGIKARLVDCKDHYSWWAVDEVFDAGEESVTAGAEAFARSELTLPNALLDDASVLRSPRRFSQYAAHMVASTLPTR